MGLWLCWWLWGAVALRGCPSHHVQVSGALLAASSQRVVWDCPNRRVVRKEEKREAAPEPRARWDRGAVTPASCEHSRELAPGTGQGKARPRPHHHGHTRLSHHTRGNIWGVLTLLRFVVFPEDQPDPFGRGMLL